MDPNKVWRQYLGGEQTPEGLPTRTIRSPFGGAAIGELVIGIEVDALAAIARAHGAFAETRVLSAFQRYEILRSVERGIAERREEFAQTIVAEGGKTIRDARGEVDRAILTFSIAAEEARRVGGEVLPLDLNVASKGRIGLTRRFPVGVMAAITPFNFPLNLVAHKVAPALACGNPVIVKPSERTPLTSLLLAEVIAQTDWPREAFQVLTPSEPKTVGELLATDERVKVLSFTGSDKVGWPLKALANKKRVTLELGGNAAVIVHGDADVPYSVSRCIPGCFANAGQVCISVQRIFVQRNRFEEFVKGLVEGARRLTLGDPADPKTDIGPMITPEARDKALSWISEAEEGGANVLLRGAPEGHALLSPTILTSTTTAMRVRSEEAFAPLVCVEPYDTFEEALALADDSRYALQTGVFTRDAGRLFRAFDRLAVGAVIANDTPQYRVDHMPYGGERDSGFGREGVRYAIEEMITLRLLALNFPPETED